MDYNFERNVATFPFVKPSGASSNLSPEVSALLPLAASAASTLLRHAEPFKPYIPDLRSSSLSIHFASAISFSCRISFGSVSFVRRRHVQNRSDAPPRDTLPLLGFRCIIDTNATNSQSIPTSSLISRITALVIIAINVVHTRVRDAGVNHTLAMNSRLPASPPGSFHIPARAAGPLLSRITRILPSGRCTRPVNTHAQRRGDRDVKAT